MNTVLWWVIGIVIALILLGALVPTLWARRARKREKRLSHRAKRRVKL